MVDRSKFLDALISVREAEVLYSLQPFVVANAIEKRTLKHYRLDKKIKLLTKNFIEDMFNDPRFGIIYIVGYDRYAKIGYTTNLKARLKTLQCACPKELEVLYTFRGFQHDERYLHNIFKNAHLRQEWFKRNKTLNNFLKRNCANAAQ